MKLVAFVFALVAVVVVASGSSASSNPATAALNGGSSKKIDAAIQAKIDTWKTEAAKWASDPIVSKQVADHNAKGPIDGMTEDKWKVLKPRAPEVKAFETNPAGEFLKARLAESKGAVTEAFLNGAKGEKVAFTDKTSSYCHKGKAKFDKPFDSKNAWQGEPEFDESTQIDSLQIAVPILEVRKDGEKESTVSIGVLVVGLDLSKL